MKTYVHLTTMVTDVTMFAFVTIVVNVCLLWLRERTRSVCNLFFTDSNLFSET
jgi:hypothetical protein